MANPLDYKAVTNMYLYDSTSTPSNKASESLIRNKDYETSLSFSQSDIMSMTGIGRFAVGSQFEMVRNFFNDPTIEAGSSYTKADLNIRYNLGNKLYWQMQQKDYADGTNDYAARTFIWNSMNFKINDNAIFKVDANGAKTIENFSISAIEQVNNTSAKENFDFRSLEWSLNNIGNDILQGWIDPSEIGRKVNLNFTGTMPTYTYTSTMYSTDLTKVQTWNSFVNTPSYTTLYNSMKGIAQDLFDSGVSKFLDGSQRIISYGSHEENDNLTPFSSSNEFLNPYQNKGTVLFGGKGNDVLTGSQWNDSLSGGAGADNYFFTGTFGNDEVKDSDKGDTLYINGNHLDGEAFETAAGSGIYNLEDKATIEKVGNGLKLTLSGGTITLIGWKQDGDFISKNDNNSTKSSHKCA